MEKPDFSESNFAYDVFISYRQKEPDKSWVRNFLVPRLQTAGIQVCIDFLSFRLGSSLLLEMTRAVEQSRYTLAIVSPSYLTSNFAELENIMAEHLGLETKQPRLIVIMREECVPRLSIRMRLCLDMTDEDRIDEEILHLISLLLSQYT
jgi:hypothetical protein